MNSFFLNWHRQRTNTKPQELSAVFPVSATKSHRHPGGIEIEFQQPNGHKIVFDLNHKDAALLLRHLERQQPTEEKPY